MIRARAALLLPAAAVLLLFVDVLAGARSFLHYDLFNEHVPVWSVVGEALRAGQSPFWLPGVNAGQPFLYTQEAPLFYPLTVPLLLTGAPAHLLVSLFALLHLALAGTLAALFVHDRTKDRDASLLAGFAYALGTRAVLSTIWPNAAAVTAMVPLLLLGLARVRDDAPRAVPLLAAALGLTLLLSRPQSVMGAAPLLGAVALWAVLAAPHRRRAAGRLLLAGLLGAAIGAPALLPVAAIHGEMARGRALSREERNFAALGTPGNETKKLILPSRGFNPDPESSSYPGAVPLALAAAGLVAAVRRRSGLGLALGAGALLGLAFAYGDAGPYRLLSGLPVLSELRAPSRYLGSLGAAVALGAGLAAAAIPGARRRRVLAILTLAELAVVARLAAPLAPSGIYTARTPLAEHLRRLPADAAGFPARIWSVAPVFDARLLAPDGPEVVRRHDGLFAERAMAQGVDGVTGSAPALARVRELRLRNDQRALEIFGVARIVSPIGSRGLVRDAAAPTPWVVQAPLRRVARATMAQMVLTVPEERAEEVVDSRSFVPGRMALVEGSGFGVAGAERPPGDARLARRSPGLVEVEVRSEAGGVLVVRDTHASGWSVAVDGSARPLLRADGAFLGVAVPPGTHRALFRFRPPGLAAGLALGAAGAALTLLLALRAPRAPAATGRFGADPLARGVH